MKTSVSMIVLCLMTTPIAAQWLNHPSPGIPRTTDGKPNLEAPAPRSLDGTPDLSGLWRQPLSAPYVADITLDLPPDAVRPNAAKLFAERAGEFGRDDPATIGCLPSGPRHIIGGPTADLVRIVQTPQMIAMIFEDLVHRQIHLDGRKLPEDPNPSFMGYSVGRWEEDALVVETTGFNGRTWLDFGGHPHGERLRTIERFRRISFGRIERQITLIDEEFYKQPIVLDVPMNYAADTDMLEYVCAENPRSQPHLVGRTKAELEVVVPPTVLRRYVGTYDLMGTAGRNIGIATFTLSLENGRLFAAINGKGRVPMTPTSESMFGSRLLNVQFIVDPSGNVARVLNHAAEGTREFNRRR
jgi:hypothetical protein